MKLNRILSLCAIATAMTLSVGSIFAQQDNGGNGGQNGGQRRNRQGGPGGGGPGGGGGNFDPAQFQQRMMDRYQEQLGFTNTTEWDAVKPLVQKVMDARMGQMGGMFGGRNRGGGPGGPGGMGGQPNPEREALQKAIDDNAPAGQIKEALTKYKASQKVKQAKLEAAQADLKAVLAPGKQEAEAVLIGLIN